MIKRSTPFLVFSFGLISAAVAAGCDANALHGLTPDGGSQGGEPGTGNAPTDGAVRSGAAGFGGSPLITGVGGLPGFAGGGGSGGSAGAGGSPSVVDGGGSCALPGFPGDRPFTFPAGVEGTWNGYFQAFTFPSGSSSLKLTLGKGPDGADQIAVVLGSGVTPPPPNSPTDVWPPSDVAFEQDPGFSGLTIADVVEGFVYPAHNVVWQGQRVTFDIAGHQAWQDWCGLQTSYPDTFGSNPVAYNCVPGEGAGESIPPDAGGTPVCVAGQQDTPVSCPQLALCLNFGACSCNACGCAGETATTASFDITFDGNDTSGATSPTSGLGATLRLSPSSS